MAGVSAKSVVLALLAFVAAFLAFHVAAFPIFWNVAMDFRQANTDQGLGFGVTDNQFMALRLVFWVLYGSMLAAALGLPLLLAKLRRIPTRAGLLLLLALLPIWAIVGYVSFGWLEFMNACEVGKAFYLESNC